VADPRDSILPLTAPPVWSRPVLPVICLLLAAVLAGAGRLHEAALADRTPQQAEQALRKRLQGAQARTERLLADLQGAADRVAALPEIRKALTGDRASLARLFTALDDLSGGRETGPALTVHAPNFAPVAWTGRGAELSGLETVAANQRAVFVLAGSVTTTLIAAAPVRTPDGHTLALATAALPVKVRRNIRNQYLSDFDRVAGADPSLEVHYLDARDDAPRPFPPVPGAMEAPLRTGDGRLIGIAHASPFGREPSADALARGYRRGTAALVWMAVLLWTAGAGRLGPRARLSVGATALRLAALGIGWPLPLPHALQAPDTYASTLLGPLLRSPLDLLLTAIWTAVLAAVLFDRALLAAPSTFRPFRTLLGGLLALPALAAVFTWIADTCANSALDVETITLLPRSPAHVVIPLALLAVLATGLLIMAAAFSLGGPPPRGARERALLAAAALAFTLVAYLLWPKSISLPLLPAILLSLLAAVLASTHPSWSPRIRGLSAEGLAGLALATIGLLALILYPSLVHYGEKGLRLQIERDHAPLILRQPQWRAFVLNESQRRVDALSPLEDAPEGPNAPGIEELAFATWSATDLGSLGFSSAVEVQDATGVVISRFALNLPTFDLGGPARPLPVDTAWKVAREQVSLASAERAVLHARRRLVYGGVTHGAVHLYVGDDLWNLPFVPGRDPYSLLFRSAQRAPARDRPVELLVYDSAGRLAFSSSDRPPALDAELAERVRRNPAGFWATLLLDDELHHTFLFSDGQSTFGLGYPRLSASRYLAGLVEAFAGLLLLAFSLLLALVLLRTLFRRPSLSLGSLLGAVRRRFALRLFVAFVAAAIIPVAVLEVVVRRFVADRLSHESEDQALERAAVAKKAVEDFAFYRREEAAGLTPVTDPMLVWVYTLIRGDLDVFGGGRLLAASKPELYASGLLLPRVPGAVFRALVLEQSSSVLSTERIGSFSNLVVSVPVKLGPTETGVLSIPLALRQREVQATLDDLDRNIRLASVAFLLFAAALAHSMSRRIAGPIRDLTEATRRVAAGDLEARVSTNARDELRELVESFNQMAGDLDRQRRDLERSNRLAAWAEMARQVAHEVKNPLTPIQLSAEHLRRVYGDSSVDFASTLATCTDTILKQVGALRRLVTEFSAFARPPAAVLEPQPLGPIVKGAVEPYLPGLPMGVHLSLDLPAGIPDVQVDRRLFERAVLNLLENALQAVGDRGEIAVSLRATDRRVELEVADSGAGLDPEVKVRLFEPFFSTKTSGSGLGLTLVKKIAEDHGGGVSLESPPGGPTRARLWLPAALDQDQRDAPILPVT
jgi:two-component system, NtrC family, nitrogen regulation sensor histidine kinase NtrY